MRRPTASLLHSSMLFAGLLAASLASPDAAAGPGAIQPATVDGGLDKSAVRTVVAAHIHEIRGCYDVELVDDETVAGRSVVTLVIQPDGSVSSTGIAESTMPDRFDACLTTVAASWTFPASDAATNVTYPFEMSPG